MYKPANIAVAFQKKPSAIAGVYLVQASTV